MKNKLKYLVLLLLINVLVSQGCKQQDKYTDEKFDSIVGRRLALLKYAKKIYESEGKKRKEYLIKYFNAFPRDFKTFFHLNYNNYHEDTLYKEYSDHSRYIFSHNPWLGFYPVIKSVASEKEMPQALLSEKFGPTQEIIGKYNRFDCYGIMDEIRELIPKDIYNKKMIAVRIGGFNTGPDGYRYASGSVKFDTMFINMLSTYTDEEILSFFYCWYDGPYPEDREKLYQYRYKRIKEYNPRVAELMKKAYEAVLARFANEKWHY
ncbi:hypothetical protein Aasi_0515 [Candidatus Amoebophilus asiaticus 5a2]|uniref:Lipoprotein n=1 Tax=Amoebophilus asiaticus (strain 5a2) TaxID=452471 RepID=B3ERR7_AMOA5|nr:hypothetical protein [Candidatus Amoebophilus asiaticus]ACE05919.1 hypothetical protein Aasi_0515 [Candidatus Amoebophilus asiaticus 5a2]